MNTIQSITAAGYNAAIKNKSRVVFTRAQLLALASNAYDMVMACNAAETGLGQHDGAIGHASALLRSLIMAIDASVADEVMEMISNSGEGSASAIEGHIAQALADARYARRERRANIAQALRDIRTMEMGVERESLELWFWRMLGEETNGSAYRYALSFRAGL